MRYEIAMIWEMLKSIFKAKILPVGLKDDIEKLKEFEQNYENISMPINMTAELSASLAALTSLDNDIDVVNPDNEGELNPRAAKIKEVIDNIKLFEHSHDEFTFATGGFFSFAVINGKRKEIYFDHVPQSQVIITDFEGNKITGLTVIADKKPLSAAVNAIKVINISLINKIFTQETKAYIEGTQKEIPLKDVSQWQDISPLIKIENVDKLLFARRICPKSTRVLNSFYGVPITYGSESLLSELSDFFKYFCEEYSKKQVRLFADERLFNKDKKLANLFTGLKTTDNSPFFKEFSPPFRDTGIINGFNFLVERIEHQAGLSRGVLSELNTSNATATEIKNATLKTFAFMKSNDKNKEQYYNDISYITDVLLENQEFTPCGNRGNYKMKYNWSYIMYEDSSLEWKKLLEGADRNWISGAEGRQFIMGGSLQQAKNHIDMINETLLDQEKSEVV